MKHQNQLVLFLFILCATLLFSGCEKDFDDTIKKSQENILPEGFEAKTYTQDELENIPNFKPLYLKAKDHLYSQYQTTQSWKDGEEFPLLDTSLANSLEVGQYKSLSFRINDFSVQDEFKNLVIEMYENDDYLLSIVTYKHDFVEGGYKFKEKEILEGTFDPFIEDDGITARCSYQFIIISIEYIYCNQILKDEILHYDYSIICQGGGNGPGSNGGVISGVGSFTGSGNSAYSPNPVYTNANQFINALKPTIVQTKFNNLYPPAKNSIINYINQNLNYPIRLSNVKQFINGLGDVENAQSYNFFNQLVNGHYISEHTSIKSEVISFLNSNHYDPSIHLFIRELTQQIHQNPTVFTSIKPFLIEKQIDDSQLDPCSKGIFQQIKNTAVCDFAQMLAKLGAEDSIYSTTIKTAHNSVMFNGQLQVVTDPGNTIRTTPGVKYNYTIFVNPDYPGKTKLYIAALLLHEVAHAYFFSLVDDYNMGATNSFNELPILFDALVVNHFPIGPDLHHEEIANSYVSAIAAALQEFQPGLPQQVYNDLAWSGLEGTTIFNTLHPIGSDSRTRILNRKAAEQTGNPIGQGTPNQQNPVGQPCN